MYQRIKCTNANNEYLKCKSKNVYVNTLPDIVKQYNTTIHRSWLKGDLLMLNQKHLLIF